MKALKYIEELIEFEENYMEGYPKGEVPLDTKKRLKDLKEAKQELLNLKK